TFPLLGPRPEAVDGCRCHQHRHVFKQTEETYRPRQIGLRRPRTDARAIAAVPRVLPSFDVADHVQRDIETACSQLRNGVEEKIESFRRNDLSDEDDAAGNALLRWPLVRPM